MKAAVVILNWNTKDYLKRWLPGLIDSVRGLDSEVIVADSASTDGSLEMLSETFPQVRQISLESNYGFTGGYDRALAQITDAELYVLINSDIEVSHDWLRLLIGHMDSHPECGACAPKLLSWYKRDTFEYAGAAGGCMDALGYTFCRGRVMKRVEKDHGQYDSPARVLWATGACLMVRSSVWHEMGGLDDRFFAHMEEVDMCWRMWLAGYEVHVVPQATVYHIGGGTLPSTSPFKLKLNYRNNLLMLDNNLARTYERMGRNPGRAGTVIRARKCLDWASALVYLLTGRPAYAKAVRQAHKEYRQLRGQRPAVQRVKQGGMIPGMYRGSMILQSILRGSCVHAYLEAKIEK